MTPSEPAPRRRGARTQAAEAKAAPEREDPKFASRYIEAANTLTADAAASAQALARPDTAAATAAPVLASPWWRSIGPMDIPDGQTYGSGPGSRVNVSGRVATIAIDPTDANHLLVGSAGGGIWETRDNGVSWSPRTDQQPTLTTGAIAFDPNAASTVYALTGEGSFYWRLGAEPAPLSRRRGDVGHAGNHPLRRLGRLRPAGEPGQLRPPAGRNDRRSGVLGRYARANQAR
jgi:hypothetical protein